MGVAAAAKRARDKEKRKDKRERKKENKAAAKARAASESAEPGKDGSVGRPEDDTDEENEDEEAALLRLAATHGREPRVQKSAELELPVDADDEALLQSASSREDGTFIT